MSRHRDGEPQAVFTAWKSGSTEVNGWAVKMGKVGQQQIRRSLKDLGQEFCLNVKKLEVSKKGFEHMSDLTVGDLY